MVIGPWADPSRADGHRPARDSLWPQGSQHALRQQLKATGEGPTHGRGGREGSQCRPGQRAADEHGQSVRFEHPDSAAQTVRNSVSWRHRRVPCTCHHASRGENHRTGHLSSYRIRFLKFSTYSSFSKSANTRSRGRPILIQASPLTVKLYEARRKENASPFGNS